MKKKIILSAVLAIVLAFGCKNQEQQQTQAPAPELKVLTLSPENIYIAKQYPADIIGKNFVNVVPKINGYVEKIVAKEGAKVKKGEVIVKISEDNYRQAYTAAKANVEVATANVENARLDVERTQSLYDNKIVSEFDLKNSKNNLALREAQLLQAQADVQNAKINLDYTNITSPIDGVIGTINCYVGTLVSPNTPTPITTVSDNNHMYAYFAMSEVDLLNLAQDSKTTDVSGEFQNPRLTLANGSLYPNEGKLDMISGIVDRQAGTVKLRASFKNNGMLRGGSNGYVYLPIAMDSVLLVPQLYTQQVQDKIGVFVVDNEGVVSTKFIKIMQETYEDKFVVLEGLTAGEKVIIENIIKLRPGMKITPKE